MAKKSPAESARQLSQDGIKLARSGHKDAAVDRFRQAVALDPTHEAAWLHLVGLAQRPDEAHRALAQLERINPNNPHLTKARAWVKQTWAEEQSIKPKMNRQPSSSNGTATVKPTQPTAPTNQTKPSPLLFWSLIGATLILILILSLAVATQSSLQQRVNQLVGPIFPTPTNTTSQELARLQGALDKAQAEANQPLMITHLEEMYTLAPYDAYITNQLAELYYERGLILRNGGNFEAAQQAFNRALTVKETMINAQLEQQQIILYQAGIADFQAGRWDQAIEAFEEIFANTPDYPSMREMLYSAYFNQGIALEANRDLEAALVAFRRAGQIMPAMTDAKQKAAEVDLLLHPPTPTPAPTATAPTATAPLTTPIPEPTSAAGEKQVIVDISEQRAYTYLGETLVHQFIISTGEPGRDTAIGEFEIQNKIPMAYASTWNLDMPFWLGIYWSGPLQNGFHAVPTVRHTGQTMWDGYLGQRVSYGCVILSMADAETLYNWVDIGTPVKIRW